MLLQSWKEGGAHVQGPKFQSNPTGLPDGAVFDPASLAVCKLVEDSLIIPSDLRQKYLQDPLRSPEWKQILKKFDAAHGATAVPAASAPSASAGSIENPAENGEDAWATMFADDPKTVKELEEKFQICSSFALPGNSALVCKVIEGPKLFVCAVTAGTFDTEQPIILHGAGTWLLDNKAQAAMDNQDCTLLFGDPTCFLDLISKVFAKISTLQPHPRTRRTRFMWPSSKMICKNVSWRWELMSSCHLHIF